MLESLLAFLLSLTLMVLCAFVAHEGVKVGNDNFPELNMSPNWSAVIGFIFGASGLIALLLYAVLKIMIKRMIKH